LPACSKNTWSADDLIAPGGNTRIDHRFLLNGGRWTVVLFKTIRNWIRLVSFGKADIYCLYFLEMNLDEKSISGRGVGECRNGTLEDIDNDPLLRSKSDEYKERLHRGDSIHICVYENQVIGYGWTCVRSRFHESRFDFDMEIPQDTIPSISLSKRNIEDGAYGRS
jgi:hypothetical protein